MEIYHRDHWIIDVHMATWKDLTKWNEENTIMAVLGFIWLYLAVLGCT